MKTVLVVGGGFFGMYLAEYLSQKGFKVLLTEKNHDFMQRASLVNQARVHNGYHYPRSILTALRSRISFPRFVEEFAECIDNKFDKYYMIGKVLGNVTGKQFEKFCQRIGASCEPAPSKITNWVNPNLIEGVYQTVEYAFDSVKLKEFMLQRLLVAGVDFRLETEVISVQLDNRGRLGVVLRNMDGSQEYVHGLDHVFNCTYSMINAINIRSGIKRIPLKHEMTEIALVQIPKELNSCAVTVMCGPFFSFMPFPSRDCHSFSHVRYTPHYEWHDRDGKPYIDAHHHYDQVEKRSAWGAMWRDAVRYMPILEETRYLESIWEVKTVLPRSESDDSRPILFKPNYGVNGYHCIMGGKIDNVFEVIKEIDRLGLVD